MENLGRTKTLCVLGKYFSIVCLLSFARPEHELSSPIRQSIFHHVLTYSAFTLYRHHNLTVDGYGPI